MCQELIHSFEQQNIFLSSDEIDIILNFSCYKTFRKHQYLIQQGELIRYHFFIIKGLTKNFQEDERGNEYILQFGIKGEWVPYYFSLCTNQPATFNVDCLDETVVLQIASHDLSALCKRIPKFNQYFQSLLHKELQVLSHRLFYHLSKTALERYQDFVLRYPQIEQSITNNQIASYLGITPQSLSRLRRQVMNTSA